MLCLEPRLMFDAATGAVVADVAAQQVAEKQVEQILPPTLSTEAVVPPAVTPVKVDTEKHFNADNRITEALSLNTDSANSTDIVGIQALASALSEHQVTARAGQQFVFVDTSVSDYQTLLTGIDPAAQVVLINANQDGVQQIASTLANQQNVDALYLLSHGSAGEIKLGSSVLNSDTMSGKYADALHGIAGSLGKNADILVYGCDFAAGSVGLTAVNQLAELTGAHIAASNDNTGATTLGGDWNLEVQTGSIDVPQVLNPLALSSYQHLLDAPVPLVSLSGEHNVDIGGNFTFTATFKNSATTGVGFGPYIDLLLPATGKDGNDGVNFVSASYLGQAVTAYTLTFDANGHATHPLAQDNLGHALIVNAATYGLQAGDKLVVLQLPFGSVTPGQPDIPVIVTANLSNLADVAANAGKDLTISALAGYQFGADSLNNPQTDPSIEAVAAQTFNVHPTLVSMTQTFDGPENDTATGPNYVRHVTNTATIAAGQSLTNFDVSQNLPNNIFVTGITPDAGGVIKSITLADNTVISSPTAIASTLATGAFLQAYMVEYATFNATKATQVSFYVPELDATGAAVINPGTGAATAITLGAATGSGSWTPADPRDPATVVSATTASTTFAAKSLAIQDSVVIAQDIGTAGLTPGDTLLHNLQIDVSDYFAFGSNAGQWLVHDVLNDGQTFDTGFVPTLNYSDSTGSHSVALVRGVSYFVGNAPGDNSGAKDGTGKTHVTFDLTQALPQGLLSGDLHAGGAANGASQIHIGLRSIVDNSYQVAYAQSILNEGDSVNNNSDTQASVLDTALVPTGGTPTDSSSDSSTIEANALITTIVGFNGAVGVPDTLKPGDTVTIKLEYVLNTGNYQNFILQSYLPLPVLLSADADANGGSTVWTQSGNSPWNGTSAGLPGVGEWEFAAPPGALNTPIVTANSADNAINFDFGNNPAPANAPQTVSVLYTMKVSDHPFADNLFLTLLGQSNQITTVTATQTSLQSDALLNVKLAEPVVQINTGVVSVSNSNAVISGNSGNWQPTSNIASPPFTGFVTHSSDVSGNLANYDAGDTVRLATAVENTGGFGAFAVAVTVEDLPAGLSFKGGSLATADLKVVRGDGTSLTLNTDYTITPSISGKGFAINFLDAGNTATLGAGHNGSTNVSDGSNVVVITYDAVADNTLNASTSLSSKADLTHYASSAAGTNFLDTSLVATATEVSAQPAANIQLFSTSDPGSSGTDLVVGESGIYAIKVTMPEGSTPNFKLSELLPPGMQIDTSYGSSGFKVFSTVAAADTEAAGLGAILANDFGGGALNLSTSGSQVSLNTDGVHTVVNPADNNTANDSFLLTVKLIATNVSGNQSGAVDNNSAALLWDNGNAGTSNGVSNTVADTIREPVLTITNVVDTDPVTNGIQTSAIDAGNPVQYTITISNPPGGTSVNAYDLIVADSFASQLSGLAIQSARYFPNGNAVGNDVANLFEINGNQLQTLNGTTGNAGVNLDLAPGDSIVLVVNGTANTSVGSVSSFDSTAQVQWSTINSGSNLPAAQDSNERTGTDGVGSGLNNMAAQAVASVNVVPLAPSLSHIGGLADTAAPSPTTAAESVAVGEIIRYRAVIQIPEGTVNNMNLKTALPAGLSFINDGTTKIEFVSNGAGIASSVAGLTVGGTLSLNGNSAGDIPADLSSGPTAVLSAAQIDVSNPQSPVFQLGNLTNADNDADTEYVIVEFNARVDNTGTVTTANSFNVDFQALSNNTVLGTSNTVVENVVEPKITDFSKTITAFNPATGHETVTLSFSNSGDGAADNVHVTDAMTGGSNYTLSSVTIGGASFTANNLPAGVTLSTSGGITADFSGIPAGTAVSVVYTVDVPTNAPVAPSDATLSFTSLPTTFTGFAGSNTGTQANPDGGRDGSGGINLPNNYAATASAGLGILKGTLWDDTGTFNGSINITDPLLAGQTVSLIWAGADGNFATAGDNQTFTTTTDSNGQYQFAALPVGNYQIQGPNSGGTITDNTLGSLEPFGGVSASANPVIIAGAETVSNFGYVEINNTPMNTVGATRILLEDSVNAPLSGISVADDAGAANISVQLSIQHGILNLTLSGSATVSAGAVNTSTLTLTGNQADINATLASLSYTPAGNFTGDDTLTMATNDLGHNGIANGSLIPNIAQDALTATDTVTITVQPVNDAPSGANKLADLNQDTPYHFSAGDFGFSDTNDTPANTLSDVIITTLPAPAEGVLKLNGVPVTANQKIPLAQLANLSFEPAANLIGNNKGAFTFQVVDNGGTANNGHDTDPVPKSFAFNLLHVDHEPAGADKIATAREDTPYIFSAGDFGFSDPNDTPANSLASVIITTLPLNTDGVLTLNGVPVTANQVIPANQIANLHFEPAANRNGNGIGAFSFQVVDNGSNINGSHNTDSTPNQFSFNITPVNDPPVGTDKVATLNENQPYHFVPGDFGFSDPNDTPANSFASVTISTLPPALEGTLKLNGIAVTPGQVIPINQISNLTFVPTQNLSGNSLGGFTFQVTDNGGTGNGGLNTDPVPKSFAFDIPHVVYTPLAANDSNTGDRGRVITGQLLANDSDPGHNPLTITGYTIVGVNGTILPDTPVFLPGVGSITISANGQYTFAPLPGFTGNAPVMTYTVSNGHGGTATANLNLTVQATDLNVPSNLWIAGQGNTDPIRTVTTPTVQPSLVATIPVINAVTNARDLNSLGGDINHKSGNPVSNEVYRISNLQFFTDGLNGLLSRFQPNNGNARGHVLAEVDREERWFKFDDVLQRTTDNQHSGWNLGSLRHSITVLPNELRNTAGNNSFLSVHTSLSGGILTIGIEHTVNQKPHNDVLKYKASLADGKALPDWLHIDSKSGMLTGMPPAGGEHLKLRVAAELDDGKVLTSQVEIATDSARIVDLKKSPVNAKEVKSFSSQLADSAGHFDKAVQHIKHAIHKH